MTVAGRYVGASVLRVEDARILAGRGRYVDDLRLPGLLHAAFVRSPLPHARIGGIDAVAARELPGAVAVLTAADLATVTAALQIGADIPNYLRPVYGPLAGDRARHVGDPVAIVVAESRAAAEDAVEAVLVDWAPLPAVTTPEEGLDPGSPVLFEDVGSNVLYHDRFAHGDVEAAFASADRVISERISQQRVANVPMEGRGGIADFDRVSGELTFHASTQSPHGLRLALASALELPVSRVRVVAPDVGGAFGQKIPTHREDIALCAAAKLVGRPVKWVEDRVENLTAGGHARDEWIDVEAAVDRDGRLLGLRCRMTLDHGAYPILPIPAPLYTSSVRVTLPGPYRLPALAFEAIVVATCKASYVPYRGPWAMESFLREVMLDRIARELGLDPVEVRRRNLITAAEQPTRLVTGPTIDGVTAAETLERAVELVGLRAVRAEQAAGTGPLVGVGFATVLEPAPGPPDYAEAIGFSRGQESARARIEPDGRLTLVTAQSPHGQGHETTLAQLAAEELGVPLEQVRVVHGDTRVTPFHPFGTGGSRAATMGSGAAVAAVRAVRQKALDLAAELLEIAPDDLEIVDAVVQAKGAPDRAMPLAKVAGAAYFGSRARSVDGEPGLQASGDFLQPEGGWSQATHACVVEIDPETGFVRIRRYVVVEDCGRMINPAIVEGQIRGGVAQGIGAALLEHAVYDEDGTFVTASFMDYLLPTAMDVPPIEIEHLESPGRSARDFRGVGEGGAMAAPPAVANAIADALGVPVTSLPVTPTRVLELLDARDGGRHAT